MILLILTRMHSSYTLADPRGAAAPGTRGPRGPNSFIFMQFSAKIWKIIAILGVGAPPWGKSWICHCSRMRTARSLTISRSICHARPPAMHAPLRQMPPLPCMPPHHTCPPAMRAPSRQAHALPLHTCPPATHAPFLWTHASENITLPQLRCGRQ